MKRKAVTDLHISVLLCATAFLTCELHAKKKRLLYRKFNSHALIAWTFLYNSIPTILADKPTDISTKTAPPTAESMYCTLQSFQKNIIALLMNQTQGHFL